MGEKAEEKNKRMFFFTFEFSLSSSSLSSFNPQCKRYQLLHPFRKYPRMLRGGWRRWWRKRWSGLKQKNDKAREKSSLRFFRRRQTLLLSLFLLASLVSPFSNLFSQRLVAQRRSHGCPTPGLGGSAARRGCFGKVSRGWENPMLAGPHSLRHVEESEASP